MKSDIVERLKIAIAADARANSKISTDAGLGVNFIQQLIAHGKMPGADKLSAILAALGPDAFMYVMTGLNVTDEDFEFIRILHELSPEARVDALRFFRALRPPASDPKLSDDPKG
jgi:hypothetical protein